MRERSARLESLVDHDDLDSLFQLVTADDIAAAWCTFTSTGELYDPHGEDGESPNWWAVALLLDSAIYRYDNGRPLREVLLALVRHANDATLGSIGAGPLENFISDDPDDVQWLEEQCRADARFRTALSFSWYDSHVSATTTGRLDRAAGKGADRDADG